MKWRKSTASKWKASIILLSVLIIGLTFIYPLPIGSSDNIWMDDDVSKRVSTIKKPVDPIFINVDENTNYREKCSIGIPIGESWDFKYYLEEGKKYHIFLVGDWICNETEPTTDYDIMTTYPSTSQTQWNTESAGLPEQVANDENHQYFVPPSTGTYKFTIVNDERDSKGYQSAMFMLLEHIDVNTEYSCYLEGRDMNGDEVLMSGWAYELETPAPKIKVFVDVPDNLDMYEVRLYVMTNHADEIGYEINGLGVPFGEFFLGFKGEYGGFSTSCKGDRNIDAMDSCEHSGRDMEFIYDTPNSVNYTGSIFYYIVLIAEHEEGTVKFYAQTDFTSPNITLVDPPMLGYAFEETDIRVSTVDESEVERVWVSYVYDFGAKTDEVDLRRGNEVWFGELPEFSGGDYVNYTVFAEDKFGLVGSINSGFLVKEKTEIDCRITNTYIVGDENAEIIGRTSLESTSIKLEFSNGVSTHNFNVITDENGEFLFEFRPDKVGEWSVQAVYDGSETEYPCVSNTITFSMNSKQTHISSTVNSNQIKLNEPIQISGFITPRLANMPIEIMLVSSSTALTEIVHTSSDGSYSYSFIPPEIGAWSIITKMGDGLIYGRSQSGLMEVNVLPLNIFDKITISLLTLVTPPYLYGTIGSATVASSILVYIKREALAPYLPKSVSTKIVKKKAKKKNNGVQRYKRKK